MMNWPNSKSSQETLLSSEGVNTTLQMYFPYKWCYLWMGDSQSVVCWWTLKCPSFVQIHAHILIEFSSLLISHGHTVSKGYPSCSNSPPPQPPAFFVYRWHWWTVRTRLHPRHSVRERNDFEQGIKTQIEGPLSQDGQNRCLIDVACTDNDNDNANMVTTRWSMMISSYDMYCK